MKKLLTLLMALSMMLALFVGCAAPAAPAEPAPESSSVPEPEPEPEPVPSTVEGVIKEASLSKIIVTLADGTDLALDTAGLTDMKVNLGDEVKVEYTGVPGSAVAGKVEVTKAAPVSVTVTGVVKEATASMMLLTLEDESELVLLTKDIEGLEAKAGDKVTAEYTKGDNGAVASKVEVTEPAAPEETAPAASDAGASASSQAAAPSTPVSSGNGASSSTPAPKQNSSSGSSKSSGGSDPNDMGAAIWGWLENSGFTEEENNEDETTPSKTEKPTEDQTEKEPEPEPKDTVDLDQYAYEVIALANKKRAAAGLSEVPTDSGLMDVAATRAEELAVSYSHTMPNGEKDSYAGLPDYEWVMCNLGKGQKTPEKIVDAWMNSSEHKRNIMYPEHTAVGAGCYQDDKGTLYWCITFYRDGGKYPNY